MKIEDLEAKIRIKADHEVLTAISKCRTSVERAVAVLFGHCGTPNLAAGRYQDVMKIMAGVKSSKEWPSELWTQREDSIRRDIMSTMNTLQQIMAEEVAAVETEDGREPEEAKTDES